MRIIKHWSRIAREVEVAKSLETFKSGQSPEQLGLNSVLTLL